MKKLVIPLLLVALVAGAWAAQSGQKAPKPDLGKILGTWAIEVNADGEIFYLTLVVEKVEGQLAGKVSEQNGMFTDMPLADVIYDSEALKCTVSIPTPPDMATRPWAIELKVGDEVFEGTIANTELEIAAAVNGKRTKK
jgi:hypothetical protein